MTANFLEKRYPLTGTILYGGDYNPEQWPENIWVEDMELFKRAGINEVTLNVFSWSALQPDEETFDFSKLDRIVSVVGDAGMKIVMATSTAALPAWMTLKYPEVGRVDIHGRKMRHGKRHNACINSPLYRKFSKGLAARLAERYSSNPHLVGWHINNEYGGFCWCETCASAFREWLISHYTTVEKVNSAWNTAFWGHTYHSFDEIFPPNELGDFREGMNKAILPAYSLDYQRFYGDAVRDSFNEEKRAIRDFDCKNPVTTNMMGTFKDYDYFAWRADNDFSGSGVDVVSWDSYPAYDTTSAQTSMRHALMRAVGKGESFVLMEQTPSRQNWQPYNSLKRPGQMREQSWQAIAHGADAIQFFQLRQSRSGCEKFHGAVVGSDGTDKTRTFQECARLGEELKKFGSVISGSKVERGSVAIIFDWESWWALSYSAGPTVSPDYVNEVSRWYAELFKRNIAIDVVSAHDDLSGYRVVLAPLLYMMDNDTVHNMQDYLSSGGELLMTTMSGLVDEHDSLYQGEIPVPFREAAGIWAEETDALPPSLDVAVVMESNVQDLKSQILCDVIHADDDTQVIARYAGEYYSDTPVYTYKPSSSGGGVHYVATIPNNGLLKAIVDNVVKDISSEDSVSVPDGVEVNRRVREDGTNLVFVINSGDQTAIATSRGKSTDLLTGQEFDNGSEIVLDAFGVAILQIKA